MSTKTKIEEAAEAFRKAGGILTMSEAIQLGIHRRQLYALRDCGKPLSIDTYKPAVMREAILAGVDMINDIKGFRTSESINAVADGNVGKVAKKVRHIMVGMITIMLDGSSCVK